MPKRKLHELSGEGLNPALDLFYVPPTQTSVEKNSIIKISPLTNNNEVFTFVHEGSEEFIDLSQSYLVFHLKLSELADGAELKAATVSAPVNNTIDSMISQIQLKIGNEAGITIPQDMKAHSYTSYLHYLTSPKDVQETTLQTQMFFKDKSTHMDNITTGNPAFVTRKTACAASKVVELRAKLFHPLALQDRFMLNNTRLEFRVSLNPKKFFLMGADCRWTLLKKELHLYAVEVQESVQLAINEGLIKHNAKYPFVETKLFTRTIPATTTKLEIANLSTGVRPTRMIVGMVETEAFIGDLEKNPFNFKPFHLNKIDLSINGKVVPDGGYEVNFGTPEQFSALYLKMIHDLGALEKGRALNITPKEFKSGYTIFVFDLRPDQLDDCFDLEQSATINLNLTFSQAVGEEITLVCLQEFQRLLEISGSRKVRVT